MAQHLTATLFNTVVLAAMANTAFSLVPLLEGLTTIFCAVYVGIVWLVVLMLPWSGPVKRTLSVGSMLVYRAVACAEVYLLLVMGWDLSAFMVIVMNIIIVVRWANARKNK